MRPSLNSPESVEDIDHEIWLTILTALRQNRFGKFRRDQNPRLVLMTCLFRTLETHTGTACPNFFSSAEGFGRILGQAHRIS